MRSLRRRGRLFRDNAVLKARAAAEAYELIALSDDSGLCVEALDGRRAFIRRDGPGQRKTLAPPWLASKLNSGRVRLRRRGKKRLSSVCWRSPGRTAQTKLSRAGWMGSLSSRRGGPPDYGPCPIFRPDHHDRTFGGIEREGKARASPRRLARPVASRPRLPEASARPAVMRSSPIVSFPRLRPG